MCFFSPRNLPLANGEKEETQQETADNQSSGGTHNP